MDANDLLEKIRDRIKKLKDETSDYAADLRDYVEQLDQGLCSGELSLPDDWR